MLTHGCIIHIVYSPSGALAPLLTTVAPLVNGLFAALAPILAPVVGTLDSLGLAPLVGLAGSII
jgi:cyanate permease